MFFVFLPALSDSDYFSKASPTVYVVKCLEFADMIGKK